MREAGAVRVVAALLAAVAVAVTGCGYSLRASLPGNFKTVHVPVLENRTQEPGIEDFVTQALTTALANSGMAKIARSAEDADAVLEGQIVEYSLASLAFDSTANVTQYRLTIGLSLTLRDRVKNEVVWRQERIDDRADFRVAGQVTTTMVREQDAVRRAAVDIARAIVSLAFEGF